MHGRSLRLGSRAAPPKSPLEGLSRAPGIRSPRTGAPEGRTWENAHKPWPDQSNPRCGANPLHLRTATPTGRTTSGATDGVVEPRTATLDPARREPNVFDKQFIAGAIQRSGETAVDRR